MMYSEMDCMYDAMHNCKTLKHVSKQLYGYFLHSRYIHKYDLATVVAGSKDEEIKLPCIYLETCINN
jgi:hypothetical protein